MNQELLSYAQAAKQGGADAATTRSNLLGAGWPAAEVDTALASVFGQPATPAADSTAAPATQPAEVIQSTVGGELPPEIRGWNWGAFLLTFIWGLGNRVWISLLVFVPVLNIFWFIVLGLKGNEWAWKAKPWPSVADFKAAQKKWAIAGLVVFGLSILAGAAVGFMMMRTLSGLATQ